jgi:hypothetical protein
VPGCDLVVDSLRSETNNNQIAELAAAPRIWVSPVSETGTEDTRIGAAAVPPHPNHHLASRQRRPDEKQNWRAL